MIISSFSSRLSPSHRQIDTYMGQKVNFETRKQPHYSFIRDKYRLAILRRIECLIDGLLCTDISRKYCFKSCVGCRTDIFTALHLIAHRISLYHKYGIPVFEMPWFIMTSSNGNIFRVTGPLWGESTGDRWIPLTKASDVELWCFLWSVPEQRVEQTMETPMVWTQSRWLWRHCNVGIKTPMTTGFLIPGARRRPSRLNAVTLVMPHYDVNGASHNLHI